MILDAREMKNLSFADRLAQRRRIFADGVELNQVWYVDTDQGFLRTYDVLGDGLWHTTTELRREGKMQEDWDDVEGLASKTLMPKLIELKPYEAHP